MGLRNWIYTKLLDYVGNPRVWGIAHLDLGDEERLTKPYAQSSWVYACVRAISGPLAQLPLRFYTGTPEEPRFVQPSALMTLFARPNSRQDCVQFAEAYYANLLLRGNTIIALDRDVPNAIPRAMYVSGPDRWKPIFDRAGELDAWEFRRADGTLLRMESWQVIHSKLFNPDDDFWGLAPLAATFVAADCDRLASLYNIAYFRNGADPGGVLTSEDVLREDVRTRMLKGWEGRHAGGALKGHKVALLEGGVKYDSFKTTHKDMEFPELRRMSREEICAVFHVPAAVIGIMDDTYKAVDQAVKHDFWSDVLIPYKRGFESTLNRDLLTDIQGGGVAVMWDTANVEALRENENEKLAVVNSLHSLSVPFNDLNERYKLGFPKYAWGDIGYLPIGMVPAGEEPEAEEDEPEAAPQKPEAEEDEDKRTAPAILTRGKLPHTARQLRAWEEREARREPIEKRFSVAIAVYLNRVKRYLREKLANWNGTIPAMPAKYLDLLPKFDDELRALAGKYYKRLAVSLGPQIERHIVEAGKEFTFEIGRKEIQKFIATKTMRVVENVNGLGVNKAVRDLVARAKREGQTIGELQEAIFARMRDSRARALTIARTETAQAANGVERACEVAAGVKTHMWIAARDEVTRPTHLEMMALGAWPIGKTFPNGCMYPGDMNGPPGEVINCRCSLMAVN